MNEKNVFITGANGGIGRKTVEKFAENGCNIVAQVRNENEDFNDFCQEIEKKYNIWIKKIYFDLTNETEIKSALQDFVKMKIDIDVLVNNAGMPHAGLFQMTPMSVIHNVFNVNYFALLQITQIISRLMSKRKSGTIVNLASISGIDIDAGNCAYGASKAAVILFTKTAAKELARYNIRVNAVAPGPTETKLVKAMDEIEVDKVIKSSSLSRIAKPEEIADVIFYLASENSSYITGQIIRVDGGK